MKTTVISVIAAIVLIGGAIMLTRGVGDVGVGQAGSADNVSIVDGKQIIEISARGGYQPRRSVAKAGMPTTLRFNTSGTFDCSSAVRIPSLKVSKNLPSSGVTDIDLGSPQVATLQGSCGMGMYRFEIDFRS